MPPVMASRTRNTVVSAAPTSTTNMTGFFINVTGFSLPNEARMARPTISRSNRGRERASFLGSSEVGSSCGTWGVTGPVVTVDILKPHWRQNHGKEPAALHQEVLDNRAERKNREVGQRAHDHDRANQQSDEQQSMRGQRARRHRYLLLRCQAARRR